MPTAAAGKKRDAVVKPLGSERDPKLRPPIVHTATGSFVHIPLDRIEPDSRQPRKTFAQAEINELAASIRQLGVIEPIVVRAPFLGQPANVSNPIFSLIAGERRYLAAKLAGLETIPAVVRQATPEQVLEIQIIENLQRANIDPVEEAAGYRRLIDEFKLTTDAIAQRIGKSLRYVQARLQLLTLAPSVQQALAKKAIAVDTALQVNALPKLERAIAVARLTMAAGDNGGNVSKRAAKQIIDDQRGLARSARNTAQSAVATAGRKTQPAAPQWDNKYKAPSVQQTIDNYSRITQLCEDINAGKPIKFPKDANAIQVVYLVEKVILKDDVDALKGVGIPRRVLFGKVPFQSRHRPNRAKFEAL